LVNKYVKERQIKLFYSNTESRSDWFWFDFLTKEEYKKMRAKKENLSIAAIQKESFEEEVKRNGFAVIYT